MKNALPVIIGVSGVLILIWFFKTTIMPPTLSDQGIKTISSSEIIAPTNYQSMQFNTTIESYRYPFIHSCMVKEKLGRCDCDFDYLISHYGLAWYINANVNMQVLGKIPYTQFDTAKAYCEQFNN